jgi:RNA polymerase sigma factor (sigma-70 family)
MEANVAAASNEGSFEECFRTLFPAVARTAALVCRDPVAGPDLAQEAFARLYERWDRMRSPEHVRNFVFRVAVNLAKSQRRRRTATPIGLRGPDRGVSGSQESATDDWLSVADALAALPSRQRTCVVLVDYADLDPATVAKILGTAPGTVRMHLSKGRQALRSRLTPEEAP